MILKTTKNVKRAFTLAEMLIVMAVIGIIAAVVIPIVVSNAKKTQFVTGLEKASNVFSNIANHVQTETPMDNWDYSLGTEEFVKTYLLQYFNVAKDCGMSGADCFAETYTANNTGMAAVGNEYYKIMLADGFAVGIKVIDSCSEDNKCLSFVVDVNGSEKPNTWGRDMFNFERLENLNAIVPYGTFSSYDSATGKWSFAEDSSAATKCPSADEKLCALRVVNDGWEMKY